MPSSRELSPTTKKKSGVCSAKMWAISRSVVVGASKGCGGGSMNSAKVKCCSASRACGRCCQNFVERRVRAWAMAAFSGASDDETEVKTLRPMITTSVVVRARTLAVRGSLLRSEFSPKKFPAESTSRISPSGAAAEARMTSTSPCSMM